MNLGIGDWKHLSAGSIRQTNPFASPPKSHRSSWRFCQIANQTVALNADEHLLERCGRLITAVASSPWLGTVAAVCIQNPPPTRTASADFGL